jgi:hypothetical protein
MAVNNQTSASVVPDSLSKALEQELEMTPMLKRTTLEAKNIDPLTTKEELAEAICMELQIQDLKQVDVKALRRRNTQL